MSETKVTPAHLGSYSQKQVSITDLVAGELEKIEAAMLGNGWIRCRDGRIELHRSYLALPAPTEDPLLPHWRPVGEGVGGALQLEFFDEERLRVQYSQHITISHLCGYDYTPENYRREAEKLGRYGFICLRSQRNDDSRYTEMWYLMGLWAAKDTLKSAIEWKREVREKDEDDFILFEPELKHTKRPESEQLEAALEFLRRNCSFGTCDVSVQRLAMGNPD